MRLVGAVGSLLFLGLLVGACSSGGDPIPTENAQSTAEAITAACTMQTIGLPCDPDGSTGPLLECQGVCTLNTTGTVQCLGLAAAGVASMDGKVCGNSAGVGDAACALHCQGKACLVQNAALGAACRPTAASSPCDGQCNGAGKCTVIASACAFGRDAELCTFKTCNFNHAKVCATQNLLANTNCSNTSACELGSCDAMGVCVSGGQKGCDDGNPCTDDSCDAKTGGCIGTPNDTRKCSDGIACTTGDFCGGGVCHGGAVPLNCDDLNACTSDSCDLVTGCVHQQKDCNDNNACTVDTCTPANGQCAHSTLNCDDGNPCTVDSCDVVTGCVHKAMNCSDNDACTTDTCIAGQCTHGTTICVDGNPCTSDSCNSASGCVFSKIPGCGAGGSGGAGVGGASGANSGGTSNGGTSNGGTSGAGTGGSASGGEAGAVTGGNSGTAGSSADGGSGGSVSMGGDSAGGNSAGSSGTAGIADSGASDSGGASSTIGEAGAGDTAGTSTTASSSRDSGGCGCRTAPSGSSRGALSLGFLALALAAVRRRNRAA